jgi:hypothetical protein
LIPIVYANPNLTTLRGVLTPSPLNVASCKTGGGGVGAGGAGVGVKLGGMYGVFEIHKNLCVA